MASTASSLFAGNITNFIMSMQDKESKDWVINLDDPAVRSILVAQKGERLPPYVPPVQDTPAAAAKKEVNMIRFI